METLLYDDFPVCSGDGMLCPVCGFHCTHLASCTVDQLGEVTTVRGTGTTMQIRPTTPYRGSRIEIEAYCEMGHRFAIALRFHKGNVLVTTTELEDRPLDPYHPDELRRD
jgi:hypothetical protein